MRLTALTLAGALGMGALGLAASAGAAPLVPGIEGQPSPNIVEVWGGCGPGAHPVPGRWSRSRGVWVPPHCAPNYPRYGYAPYRAYSPYRSYSPDRPYAGWRPYGGYYRYW